MNKNITPIEKVKDKMKEGMNERAWTPDQTKAVDKVDNEFNKLMAKKGIEPYSVEAARLWKSAGFDKKMGKIHCLFSYRSNDVMYALCILFRNLK